MPRTFLMTREINRDQHKLLVDAGFYLRWLAQLGIDQDIFEIYI